jgi:hypothetical protein
MRTFDFIAPEKPKRASGDPKWVTQTIVNRYPLIDLGWDRADSQEYVRKVGAQTGSGEQPPAPSNCMWCPFASDREVLLLSYDHPAAVARWMELEAAKLAKWEGHTERNLGVDGKDGVTLADVLDRERKKHGHESVESLRAYRFERGHCNASAF